MVAARKARRLTQGQLASKVGTSQNMISMIESGGVRSSKYVMAICRVLALGLPQHHEGDELRQWNDRGRRLYERDPEKLTRILRIVEDLLGDDEPSDTT